MLNVAIVDDEAQESRRLRSYLDDVACQSGVEFCVDEFSSADAFIMQYQDGYDLVFMDIEFPGGMDGMQAARALRRMDSAVVLVFVTKMVQMAVEGYEVDALDFMVKPVDRSAFMLKMARVLPRVVHGVSERVVVRQEGEVRGLQVRLIRYLKVRGHYIEYHSREGVFSEYGSLSAAEKKLGSPLFCRCDRGCLVNFRYVSSIGRDVCVVDGEELPLARTQRAQFLKAYAEYLSGLRREG